MTDTVLKMFQGNAVHPAFFTDAKVANKISIQKIPIFLDFVRQRRLNAEAISDQKWEELGNDFELKGASEAFSAVRFFDIVFLNGNTIAEEDLRKDLETLGLDKEKILEIVAQLKRIWLESESYLIKNRLEALPTITSLRWRVDVRVSSSEYLPHNEVMAVMRIGTNDKEQGKNIHVELDEDQLSWLELNIKKIREAVAKAKENYKG
jgi:hypothetical protein